MKSKRLPLSSRHTGVAFAATLCLLLALPAFSALPPGDHALTFMSSFDGSEQPYRLFVPKAVEGGRALPLLIVLHGKGANQNSWFDYTPIKEVAELRGYLVASPWSRGDWFYHGPAEQDVLDILNRVKADYQVDRNRVYLMGHSMGGWGTWWIGLRHPDLFATICPMSGMAPEELLPNARHLSPFVVHSTDDPIVPVANSREPVERLVQLGESVEYREENGYGHSSKMIGDNLHRLFDWMGSNELIGHPSRVSFATRTPKAGKAYWLSVFQTQRFPRLATIDANFNSSGTLDMSENNVAVFGVHLADLPPASREPLDVSIDHSFHYTIARSDGWAVFTRKGNEPGWTLEVRDASSLPTYVSAVVAQPAPELQKGDHQAFLAKAMGDRLRRETGADVCLVSEDMFRFPAGPVTADNILDAYVWGDQRLVQCHLTVHQIRERLDRVSPTGRFLWGPFHLVGDLSRPFDTSTVVIPIGLAEYLDLPNNALPDTIPEYLLRSARKGEAFP